MPTKKHPDIVAIDDDSVVTIVAGKDENGTPTTPTFNVVAYTGGAMDLSGWDHPVVVDLEGMEFGKSLIANRDHDPTQLVGHVTDKSKLGGKLTLSGAISAATEAARVVKENSQNGFPWQASIEARPKQVEFVKAKQPVQVNGQSFTGPLYVARKSVLKGFAFLPHGADDNTSATIAATAASTQENDMDPKLKAWIEAMGFVAEDLTADQIAGLTANYEGKNGKKKPAASSDDPMEKKVIEAGRRKEIKALAEGWCENALETERYDDIAIIRAKRDEAILAGMSVSDFEYELKLATLTNVAPTIHATNRGITNKVLEAAVCRTGGLENIEKAYDDQTLQAAHDHFRHGIGLAELILLAAESNGYRSTSHKVTIEAQRAAFGMGGGRHIHASGMFSTISLPNTFANVANKFIREQFMHVDSGWRDIAAIRSVTDFRQITTVSLTGDMMFEQVGAGGEIKHGELGEEVYTNQADTYAKMFAITRKDIINDDLGALTQIPRRLGRGAALKLNDIFWAEFMNPSVANFFHTNNANVSTVEGRLNATGLDEANTIFMLQTDPDGLPLGSMPRILLVPTALGTAARQLMTSELMKGDLDEPDKNVWQGRFKVVETPYLQNSAYTGNGAGIWYLLADPMDIPVIEVVALNGQIEPTVDTADADFNVLGIQMRGYSDVGVRMQEPRGGVRADGSAP